MLPRAEITIQVFEPIFTAFKNSVTMGQLRQRWEEINKIKAGLINGSILDLKNLLY